MNKIKLSDLFSAREYKNIKLDSRIVDSILKKTIFKKRTSILKRAVFYLSPVVAVVIIFVLYQNFFVEIQQTKNMELNRLWWLSTSKNSSIDTFEYEAKKDETLSNSREFNEPINNFSVMENSIPEEETLNSSTLENNNSIISSSNHENTGLQSFDDDWIDENSDTAEPISPKQKDNNNNKDSVIINKKQTVIIPPSEWINLPGSASSSVEKNYTSYYVWGWILLLILIFIIYLTKRRRKK